MSNFSAIKGKLESLNGKIVCIESKLYPGYYLDACPQLPPERRGIALTPCKPTELAGSKWAQWKLHYARFDYDTQVCFESVMYPGYYLSFDEERAGTIEMITGQSNQKWVWYKKYSQVPSNIRSAGVWGIDGSDLSNVGIHSKDWGNRGIRVHSSLATSDYPRHFVTATQLDKDSNDDYIFPHNCKFKIGEVSEFHEVPIIERGHGGKWYAVGEESGITLTTSGVMQSLLSTTNMEGFRGLNFYGAFQGLGMSINLGVIFGNFNVDPASLVNKNIKCVLFIGGNGVSNGALLVYSEDWATRYATLMIKGIGLGYALTEGNGTLKST